MEGLQLVGFDRSFVSVQVSQRVLSTVVVSVIVRVDGLRFQTSDGVELLDGSSTQAGQSTKDGTLDFSDFRVFDRVDLIEGNYLVSSQATTTIYNRKRLM